MKILKNHQGMSLPLMLGIVTFVLAIVSTLLSYAVFQSQAIDATVESSEAYINAVQKVDATVKIIVRDQNVDPTYLSNLSAYMGVNISTYSSDIWMVESDVLGSVPVTSYITNAADEITTYTEVFDYMGTEPTFTINPLINYTTLLEGYFPTFLDATFPALTPQTSFTDWASIITYARNVLAPTYYQIRTTTTLTSQSNPTVSGHWIINGNVTLTKSLTIPAGYLLIIDGNLTMSGNTTITGNVVIDGNLILSGSNKTFNLRGTFYIKGYLDVGSTNSTVNLGTISRPTFVFTGGKIDLSKEVSGYGYFIATSFRVYTGGWIDIYGGVYAPTVISLLDSDVLDNPSLDPNLLINYGVVPTIADPAAGPEPTFKYTYPQ